MGNSVKGKDVAIIAHITVIGMIIALILNSNNKTEFGSYHIRQTLGLWITTFLLSFVLWIPIIGWILALLPLVMWIVGIINALSGYEKPMPVLGHKFAEWFKSV